MNDRTGTTPIPHAPGYFADPDGNVYSTLSRGNGTTGSRWRLLRPGLDTGGYPKLTLRIGGIDVTMRLHEIIARTFAGPKPTPASEVRHVNGVRRDCRASNLCWGTALENAADRERHGHTCRGKSHARSALTESEVRTIRSSTESQRAMAGRFGVSQYAIWSIRNRKTWEHVQ